MCHPTRQRSDSARVVELCEFVADGALVVHAKRRVPVVRDAHHKNAPRIATSKQDGALQQRRKFHAGRPNRETLVLVVHTNQERHEVPIGRVDLCGIHALIEIGSGPSCGGHDGSVEKVVMLVKTYTKAIDQLVGPTFRLDTLSPMV